MKLMIIKTVRISEELDREISKFARKHEISQQAAIRLAIQKGLQWIGEFLMKEKNQEGEK